MDSVRALMMIRAYRMRGHLAADLDPLRLKEPRPTRSSSPPPTASRGRHGPADLPRTRCWASKHATLRQIIDILKRTYCGTLGVEFMHISDPEQKAWIQERIEGADKSISFTPNGKKAILNKLIEGEGFEQFLNVKYTGTKRFGPRRRRVDDPRPRADHQARRPAGLEGDRLRHGASRPPQRAGQRDVQALLGDLHEFKGGSSTR